MEAFPHHYQVTAIADPDENVVLKSDDMPQLISAPPAEFGGPGNHWSPEHLLVASVADCFILTFRAIARASKLPWEDIDVKAEGVLDRVDKVTRFTAFIVRPTLTIPADVDAAKAERLLEKAEAACLVTNSLDAETTLEAVIITAS